MNILSDLKVIDKRYHPGILGSESKTIFLVSPKRFSCFRFQYFLSGICIQLSEGSLPEFCGALATIFSYSDFFLWLDPWIDLCGRLLLVHWIKIFKF